MAKDAIDSTRSLFLGSLAIYVLWFVSLPAATEKLHLYQEARDLMAWIYLKEQMGGDGAVIFSQFEADQAVTGFEFEHGPAAP